MISKYLIDLSKYRYAYKTRIIEWDRVFLEINNNGTCRHFIELQFNSWNEIYRTLFSSINYVNKILLLLSLKQTVDVSSLMKRLLCFFFFCFLFLLIQITLFKTRRIIIRDDKNKKYFDIRIVFLFVNICIFFNLSPYKDLLIRILQYKGLYQIHTSKYWSKLSTGKHNLFFFCFSLPIKSRIKMLKKNKTFLFYTGKVMGKNLCSHLYL